MPFIQNTKSTKSINIFYEDYGEGKPVILIHGWPLSHKAWEGQVEAIVNAGFRCITYDRRGFGASTAPWNGYDYSSLTSDLRELIVQLDLHDCTIVGFSMGGGEVVRYFTEYGNDRIEKAALVSSIIPLVKQKDDNPNGVPENDLQEILTALKTDRVNFLASFHKNFYNADDLDVSQEKLHYDWSIASHASPNATIKCAESWANTDFREELKNVNVPTLIIHGKADKIVPIETSGDQASKGISDNQYHKIEKGPHGLNFTHKDELNELLITFCKQEVSQLVN